MERCWHAFEVANAVVENVVVPVVDVTPIWNRAKCTDPSISMQLSATT
jgi:hypothetical protein